MAGANAASMSNKRGLRSVYIRELPLERQTQLLSQHPSRRSGPVRECQMSPLPAQRVESILRLLNAAGLSLRMPKRRQVGLPRVLTRQLGLLPDDLPVPIGVWRHIGGDLGAEIRADERSRHEGCGDRENGKSPRALRFDRR